MDGLKGISKIDFIVADTEGKILATTFQNHEIGNEEIVSFVKSQADSQAVRGYQFYKVYDENRLEYVLIAGGSNDDVYMIGKMAAFQIQNLLVAYKERFDKDNFIKNLLLDNLLLVDIYNRARSCILPRKCAGWYLFWRHTGKRLQCAGKCEKRFSGKSGDFITAVDEKSIIIVKEVAPEEGYAQMQTIAENILDVVGRNPDGSTHIAYGTIVKELKEVSRSYKEARMALDVGRSSLRKKK